MQSDLIDALARKHYDAMVDIRHRIHRHPELGLEEHLTSRLVAARLAELGIPAVTGLAGTGVLGRLEGRAPGRTVLLRADMDALPIQEEVDVPYRSLVPNRMHACGHDGHVAGLLGAAMILNELRETFEGTIKLMFQPGEEFGGGALKMIQAGVLEHPKVDAAFGCHLWGTVKAGQAQVRPGPMMAGSGTFRMVIHGKGGHGGQPHLAIDPITIGAQAVVALQTIASRRINPLEPVVVSLGSIHSGDASNVIPELLEARGTIRTFNEATYREVLRDLGTLLQGVAQAHGATCLFEPTDYFPALVNDREMAELAAGAFARVVGADNVNCGGAATMGNEDFAYVCQAVPSAFIFVGIAGSDGIPVCHHHPSFRWDDQNLLVLARGLAQTAVDFLSRTGPTG
jgi:amidohydrolase